MKTNCIILGKGKDILSITSTKEVSGISFRVAKKKYEPGTQLNKEDSEEETNKPYFALLFSSIKSIESFERGLRITKQILIEKEQEELVNSIREGLSKSDSEFVDRVTEWRKE